MAMKAKKIQIYDGGAAQAQHIHRRSGRILGGQPEKLIAWVLWPFTAIITDRVR